MKQAEFVSNRKVTKNKETVGKKIKKMKASVYRRWRQGARIHIVHVCARAKCSLSFVLWEIKSIHCSGTNT